MGSNSLTANLEQVVDVDWLNPVDLLVRIQVFLVGQTKEDLLLKGPKNVYTPIHVFMCLYIVLCLLISGVYIKFEIHILPPPPPFLIDIFYTKRNLLLRLF